MSARETARPECAARAEFAVKRKRKGRWQFRGNPE